MSIENTLMFLVPDAKFHGRLFTQDDYENKIVWVDSRPKPTWAEIQAGEIALQAKLEADRLEKLAELADIDALRAEYRLTELKNLKIKDLQTAVKKQIAAAGGVNKAIEQLAIAVALLERKLYGKL